MSGERTVQHPPGLQSLKDETRLLICAYGGQEAAAVVTGKGQSRLSAYGHVNHADFAPVNVIMTLEARTHGTPGHPRVTRFLASSAGYLLVAKPAALPANADWCAALGDAVADFNGVQERLLRALPGGVTAREIRDQNIRGEIAEAQQRLAQLDQLALIALEEAD